MMSEEHAVKVSVCVVTYNQEAYLDECLRSLIAQSVSFSYEIIVGDDASTDGTRKIIESYRERFPDLIVPVYHDENVGAIKNIVSVYRKARGQYIAHLDGDDYAAPSKLAKQVEILDANPDCTLCAHDVVTVDKASRELKRKARFSKSEKKGRDFLIANLPFFAHSSKMFRSDVSCGYYDELPDDSTDFELHLRHLKDGRVYFIAEFLGFYRVFAGIATSNKRINPILPIATRRVFDGLLAGNDSSYSEVELKKIYSASILRYALGSFLVGDLVRGRDYADESLKIKIFSIRQLLTALFYRLPFVFRVQIFKVYKALG